MPGTASKGFRAFLAAQATGAFVEQFPLLGGGKADFQALKAEARRLEGL